MSEHLKSLLAASRRGLGSLKVVMATGLYKTAAGVVGARQLKEHAAGLRAYLAVQLRSSAAAVLAFAAIEDAIEHGSADQLARGPTRRAALYLMARNYVEYERLFGDGAAEGHASNAPWDPAPPGRPPGWGRALDELRFSLSRDEAEILELSAARGLSAEELAYALGVAKDEVARRMDAAAAYARLLVEDVFAEDPPALEALAKDAFSVLPPTPEELSAAKPSVAPLPPGTLIGDRYEIEARLGGGEFAYVYRARDVKVAGHVVALKLLHRVARTPAAREGAIRELSLIASAFHPSLVHFKDHGWFEDRLWFVMPFYQGKVLLDRIVEGPLPLEDALEHFERLARALAALHAAGIRHQDIKPENIFLVHLETGASAERPEILPVLLDLGVAAPQGDMALAGTPMYFPPEVAARLFEEECELPVTAKADVFALALSLLHSIEEPDLSEIEGREIDHFLRTRADQPPAGPRQRQHAHLKASFARWLAYDPKDRPSAGQLADEIGALRRGKTSASRLPGMARVLKGAFVAAGLAAAFVFAATRVDAPPGERSPTPASERSPAVMVSDPPPAEPPLPETDAVRLLRERLATEERRALALETELSRLRRRQLELDVPADAPELEAAFDLDAEVDEGVDEGDER